MPPRRSNSPRASLIQALAEQIGLSELARVEAEAVRHRPVPPRLLRRLTEEIENDLTPREREVLVLLASGYKRHEIAEELGITIETVKHHLRKAYLRLGAHNAIEAVNAFIEHGS